MFELIVPIILIVISLGIIGFLVRRSYKQLNLINVDSIPEIKEAKKKYELMKRRLDERSKQHKNARDVQLVPVKVQWKSWQEKFRNYVNNIADQLREQKEDRNQKAIAELSTDEKQAKSKILLQDARRAREQDELEFAEKCYIEAIRLNPRGADAYRGLSEVYLQQEQVEEAKETLHFLNQLSPEDDSVLLKLAEIAEEENNIKAAIEYYEQAVLINDSHAVRFYKLADLLNRQGEHATALESIRQAVELEPQNPKYLDNLIETAIMVEQTELAEEGLKQLRTVNPDNQKIEILQDKIRILVEKQKEKEETE